MNNYKKDLLREQKAHAETRQKLEAALNKEPEVKLVVDTEEVDKLRAKLKQSQENLSQYVPKQSVEALEKKVVQLKDKLSNTVSKEEYASLEDKYWELVRKTPDVVYIRTPDLSQVSKEELEKVLKEWS